jgi:hypothetical protein
VNSATLRERTSPSSIGGLDSDISTCVGNVIDEIQILNPGLLSGPLPKQKWRVHEEPS